MQPERGAMASGECSCGAARFEVDAALTDVVVCRLSSCRRSTFRAADDDPAR
jgi:hypothetical protein